MVTHPQLNSHSNYAWHAHMNSTNQIWGVNRNNKKSRLEVGRKTRENHRGSKKEVVLGGYIQNRLYKCMKVSENK